MSVVYDAVVPQSIITENCTIIKKKGDWHNTKDEVLQQEAISETLTITIKKDFGKLRLQLHNPL